MKTLEHLGYIGSPIQCKNGMWHIEATNLEDRVVIAYGMTLKELEMNFKEVVELC